MHGLSSGLRLAILAGLFGLAAALMGCGPSVSSPDQPDAGQAQSFPDASIALADADDLPFVDSGTGGGTDPFTVYASADHVLYKIDLQQKTLVTIGPFNAPQVTVGSTTDEDVITDLAVAPDSTIYVVSETNLYTADPGDGHVTLLTKLQACGTKAVALSFTNDGSLYAGDFSGHYCKIDLSTTPATVSQVGTLGMNMALAGDIVAVNDGTMYGTAIDTTMSTATNMNNILVKLDPTTGMVLQKIGSTGFPNMFGVAFALGQVFGFTHDGTGRVVTIDPTTGQGTLFGTFTDPTTGKGISFGGAGVNPMVPPIS